MVSQNKNAIDSLSDDQFREIISSSSNLAECMRKIGMNGRSATNYRRLRTRMQTLGLTYDDLKDYTHHRGKFVKYDDCDIFKQHSHISGSNLKLRYLKIRPEPYMCDECGISEWNTKPLTLELDHIDGDVSNNELSNLRLLCPNCHSQTSTYRRQKVDSRAHFSSGDKSYVCTMCGKPISKGCNYCADCYAELQYRRCRKWDVDRVTLKKLIREHTFVDIAKMYEISDNAVRKRCKRLNLPWRVSEIIQYSDDEWINI